MVSGGSWPACSSPRLGDVTRFAGAPQLCSWAGLTPRHHESDTTVRRGHITKQGSPLVRWAAVEAVAAATAARRRSWPTSTASPNAAARPIARVAAARKVLTLVYYGLRDGRDPLPRRPARGGGVRGLVLSTARARALDGPHTPWRGRTLD